MNRRLLAAWFTLLLGAPILMGQVETHLAAARAAGAKNFPGLFDRICSPEALNPPPPPASTASATPPALPAPSTWHVEPVKVFDNLYFLGEKEYSVWAVTTPEGIIVIDTIFGYSVETQVVEGMKKMGLDPKTIKYAMVSHGHNDHVGGAWYLQEHFGTHVIMSAADWDLVEKSPGIPAKPRRDMVATDGMKLTLGGTTLTLYLTPGHTPGTISTILPVTDHGQPHVAAAWGGTAFNFARSPDAFRTYIRSAERFRDIAAQAGADVIIANHTNFDGSKDKLPALATRKNGDPHPYVVGRDGVRGYLTVASECATAAMLSLK